MTTAATATYLERSAPFKLTRSVETNTGDGLTFEGYAAVFNAPTRIDSWEGTFDETIAPGAFKKTLRERTPVLQFDHGHHPLIGSIPIGSINSAAEDDHGVRVSARLTNNWLIQPVRDAIASGAVNGMSFRFEVVRERWTDADGKVITDPMRLMEMLYDNESGLQRTLVELRCRELGPVVFPAYPDTTASVRSQQVANSMLRSESMRRGIRSSLVSKQGDVAALLGLPDSGQIDLAAMNEVATLLLFGARNTATSASAPAPESTRAVEADEDPGALAQAVDAALDEASTLLATVDQSTLPPEVQQAIALITAAEVTVDQLLDVMGVEDPDDDDADDAGEPAGRSESTADLLRRSQSTLDSKIPADEPPAGKFRDAPLDSEHPSTDDAPVPGDHPSNPKPTPGNWGSRASDFAAQIAAAEAKADRLRIASEIRAARESTEARMGRYQELLND